MWRRPPGAVHSARREAFFGGGAMQRALTLTKGGNWWGVSLWPRVVQSMW